MSDDQNTTEDTTETEVDETTEETTETEEGSETGTDTAKVLEEWTPPTKEEWEAHQKNLKDTADRLTKVNKESADRRLKIRDLERQNEDDAERAKREAEEAAQAKYKPVAAKAALLEAKARTDRVGALITLMDMNRVEFDGNNDVVGLDLEVQRLAEQYPEFFVQPEIPEPPKPAPAPVAKPAPKAAVAPKPVAKRDLSPGEILAGRILGTSTE